MFILLKSLINNYAMSNNLKILFLFSIFGTLYGSNAYTLEGYVSGNGRPLEYVSVVTNDPLIWDITDSTGYYKLKGLKQDEYKVEFHLIGYSIETINVTFKDSLRKINNTELKPYIIEFSPINVLGFDYYIDKGFNDLSIRYIEPSELEEIPTVGESDIFRTLQSFPETNSISEISNQLYVRGGTPDQNLILINGAPIYQPYHLFGLATAMNIDAIEQVEFYSGSFPVKYGDRLSSVISINSASGTDSIKVKTNINLLDGRISLSGPVTEKGRWRFSGRRMYLDYLSKLVGSSFPYYYYDYQYKIAYMLNDNNLITINHYSSFDLLRDKVKKDYYMTYWDIPIEESYVDSNYYYELTKSNISWENSLFSLEYYSAVNDHYSIHTSVYRTQLDQNFIYTKLAFPGKNASDSTISFVRQINDERKLWGWDYQDSNAKNILEDFGIRHNQRIKISDKHIAQFGIFYSNISLKYKWEIEGFDELSKYSTVFLDFAPDTLHYNNGYSTFGIYSEYKLLLQKYALKLGVRLTKYNQEKEIRCNPMFSLSYKPIKQITASYSYGRYYQALGFSVEYGFYSVGELYLLGNKLEECTHSIFEISYNINPISKILVTIYRKTMTHLLYMDLLQEVAVNDGEGYSKGVEISIYKLPILNSWFSLMLTFSDFKKYQYGESYYPNYYQPIKLNLLINKEILKNTQINFNWSYSTGRYANLYSMPSYTRIYYTQNTQSSTPVEYELPMPMNLFQYPPFHRLDIKVSRKLNCRNSKIKVYLQVLNVYNRENILYYNDLGIKYKNTDSSDNVIKSYYIKGVNGIPFLPTIGAEISF